MLWLRDKAHDVWRRTHHFLPPNSYVNPPVFTIAEDVEASPGAALLAAFGSGLIDADQVKRGWVQPAWRASPEAGAQRRHAALFEQYLAPYPALEPVMHRLREIGE